MRCGLELHMQLDTGKLYCRCPNIIKMDEKPDYVIKRKLRAVVGETGELDIAAKREEEKHRVIHYNCYNDSVCLVDTDEEPPKEVDDKAFRAALEIALLLNMKPVDEFHIMRKLIIDGSAVGGFQRTGLLANNGYIQTSLGKVRIKTLMLEEDSAKRVDDNSFSLDRLGIPLVEVGTEADITDPNQAKEAAEKIGMLSKFTGKLMRGIGTIRQDVNVSIEGGDRVEIKGVQDLRMMPDFVKLEVERQQKILLIRDELNKKKAVLKKFEDLSKLFEHTNCTFIKKALIEGEHVIGARFTNAKGILGTIIQADKRFGKEIAEYLNVYTGVKGILHLDELPNYGVTKEEVAKVLKELKCDDNDSFILVMCEQTERSNVEFIIKERVEQAYKGVFREVRAPNHTNGTTSFMRPLPGSARMYPETDIPVVRVTGELVGEIITHLSQTPEQKYDFLIGSGLNNELAQQLLHNIDKLVLFEKVINETEVDNKIAASLILNNPVEELKVDSVINVFKLFDKGAFSKEAVPSIIERLKKEDFEKVVNDYRSVSTKTVMNLVLERIDYHASEIFDERAFGVIMKELMAELRGRVDASDLSKVLKEELEKKKLLK
ncbi:Glutamyl-tRNA(Gln) amidotransferase subunit E [Candidatus Tiddalikarchaeum anstoanum]|nr:Glutamyl-tRNA(Gln) amidotransferase subunit E [Candidatus Tiddalikarchaeum anstoanum]